MSNLTDKTGQSIGTGDGKPPQGVGSTITINKPDGSRVPGTIQSGGVAVPNKS